MLICLDGRPGTEDRVVFLMSVFLMELYGYRSNFAFCGKTKGGDFVSGWGRKCSGFYGSVIQFRLGLLVLAGSAPYLIPVKTAVVFLEFPNSILGSGFPYNS